MGVLYVAVATRVLADAAMHLLPRCLRPTATRRTPKEDPIIADYAANGGDWKGLICRSASDLHFLPVSAAKVTQSLIELSDEQRQVVEKELDLPDEGPLLCLKWQSQVAVGTVCDAIATFGRRKNARRDSGEGCHRWPFHFDHYQDLGPCKRAVKLVYSEAFAHTPDSISDIEAVFGAAARTQSRWHLQSSSTSSPFVKMMQGYSIFSTCSSLSAEFSTMSACLVASPLSSVARAQELQ